MDIVFVSLVSTEGEVFKVNEKAARKMKLVNNMIEDSGLEEDIPLPAVRTEILTKIITYCVHHLDNPEPVLPKPLPSYVLAEVVKDPFDLDFVNVDWNELAAFIEAANYLELTSLLDLCCAKVAIACESKTPEQICTALEVDINKLSSEEIEYLRDNTKWTTEPINREKKVKAA
jgi:S-phase kinase-associated protein 1